MVLSLDRLTKQYGNKIAVDHLSAELKPGVYGLLGANGAGKTTLMRMICGILKPNSGDVILDGESILFIEWSENIASSLPENTVFVDIAPGNTENERIITVKGGGF